jgi:phosphatidylglycerophosphate synthase
MSTPWQLPGTSLLSSVVGANAIGFLSIAAVSWIVQARLHLSDAYVVKASGGFALVMFVATGFLHTRHPFSRFGAANHITAARVAVVSLVAGLLGESLSPAVATSAATASAVVTMLDGADGWMARRTGMASVFGARFDMETDALLIMVLSLLTWQAGKAGAWIVLAGLLRYVFVAAGWVLPWLRATLPPSRRRQTICVLQIIGLSLVVLPVVTPPASVWCSAALLAMLSASFLVDTVWLWRHRA